MSTPPSGQSEWRRLKRAFGYAFQGVAYLLQSQRNARIHAVMTLLVVTLSIGLQLSAIAWCCLVLAISLVWVAEALNTALELLANAVHPHHHPLIGLAKDVGAAAVLMASLGALVVGMLLLLPPLWTVVARIIAVP